MRMLSFPAFAMLLAIPASAQQPDISAADRAAHQRMMVIDTHLDTPTYFEVRGWDFAQRHRYEEDNSQIDLPRMDSGGLDGGFFVIYTPQGALTSEGYAEARDAALMRAMAIQRTMAANAGRIGLATTPDEAERLVAQGRHFAFQSIENSWPLGEDLSLLTTFYRLGVRMAGPVHSRTNQLADSATGEARWHGLSPLGRQWVAEMNRLGMIIDGSHSSDETFDQMLALSRVPIILSHSGPRAIHEHRRNLDDARMRRLAEAGGLMMINSVFLVENDLSDEREALQDRQKEWGNLDAAQRRRLTADLAALNARRPYTTADFDAYMRSMLHAIRVMGVDHVGLGADWDGGGGVIGMEDIASLPRISARLRREGLSEADIAKVMGGNLLRVMRQVQAGATR
ncbi:MAG: membrane dipeptidase [Alphaproteobacteria bacterium]|nr:MAG: membrane dipeptidase [Alphaproteobacteria bacterium]